MDGAGSRDFRGTVGKFLLPRPMTSCLLYNGMTPFAACDYGRKTMKKISDNPSAQELQNQIEGMEALRSFFNLVPFSKDLFPDLGNAFESLDDIVAKAAILQIPDRFNEIFSQHGWIAYESMSLSVMTEALEVARGGDLAGAEQLLADFYDDDALTFGIMRCQAHPDFRKRIRLIKLAKDDYLSSRYHGCVPLLLALIDGVVNDISKRIGFFAEGADMTAWDSIAAHETGLMALAKIMGAGRNKTTEDAITIPYRNGILHGRELAYDNKIVAAKCWAALFAIRDWASALADEKGKLEPKREKSWGELLHQIGENEKLRRALDEWVPRATSDLGHMPSSGPSNTLPKGTPEQAVAEFLDNWCNRRYGPMADALLDFVGRPKGQKAGNARRDFGGKTPVSYRLLTVNDEAAAASHVELELMFGDEQSKKSVRLNIRVVYNDADNNPAAWRVQAGNWKIVQNGFSDVIYRL